MAARFGALRFFDVSTTTGLRGQCRTLWNKSETKHSCPRRLCSVTRVTNYSHVTRTLVSEALVAQESGISAKPVGFPWRIVSAVCVQRFPTLSRQKTQFEVEFEEHKDIRRGEKSRISNHELTQLDYARKRAERNKKALAESLDDTQVRRRLSPQELFGSAIPVFCVSCHPSKVATNSTSCRNPETPSWLSLNQLRGRPLPTWPTI